MEHEKKQAVSKYIIEFKFVSRLFSKLISKRKTKIFGSLGFFFCCLKILFLETSEFIPEE